MKFEKDHLRKELIRRVVSIYKKQFADEYRMIVKAIKELRETRANKFAADTESYKGPHSVGEPMRFILRIPYRLEYMVNSFLLPGEPKFLEDEEEMRWFAKEFPEFKIPEKL